MKKLRIHYLQHVDYEGLGSIEEWINSSGHLLTSTRLFEKVVLPSLQDIDWLIIMGGPMNVDDEKQYPWLVEEKKFIRQAIDADRTVLGICLGSQLVSSALGAKVFKNKVKEIGWYDIELTRFAQAGKLFFDFGKRVKVFHWHGDTFDLPEKAVHLASSAACKNQAYIYKDKVMALQFHLETTLRSLEQMIEHGKKELSSEKYIQTGEEILAEKRLIETNKIILFKLLDRLAEQKIR
jgi:GMP synthase-like glutamine amidotransferase